MTSAQCEFCDKRGLPLLLVRDAVAPAGAGAPVAVGPPIELAAGAAHYTKRLLRSGYVYVYDEARKRWESYFVTAEGYLYLMRQTPGQAPLLPAKPFNCPDDGHRAVASCITVPDPKHATKVWIGFSDVLWTEAVQEAHAEVACRKRHMVEVDIKAALKSSSLHIPIRQIRSKVAEYAMTEKALMAAFGWGPFNAAARQRHGDRLVEECERLRPASALAVTIPDPAGVVQELAFLMKRNADLFLDLRPDDKRKASASAAIDQIESAIRISAENTEIVATTTLADQHMQDNQLAYAFSENVRKTTEKLREISVPDLNRAADDAWMKYDKKFHNKLRQSWSAQFLNDLNVFDAGFVAPLAANHVAWMKSDYLWEYFACNYDSTHPESGAVYTAMISHCIASTQDKKGCADLYKEWLGGDVKDTRNLLLRAMIFNQKIVADVISTATTVNIDSRQIPWDNLFSVYAGSIGRLSENAQDVAALLVVQIAGPLSWAMGKVIDGRFGLRGAIMALGLIARHPVVVCELTGTRKAFRAHVVKQLLESSQQVVSKSKMKQAVNVELKRLEIHGANLNGNAQRRWIMLASQERLSTMPSGLNPKQRAEWLAKSLHTVESMDQLNLGRWRVVITRDIRFGVIAGILQTASLTKLMADEEKSMANESKDAKRRLIAGVVSVAGTTSEILGNVTATHIVPRLQYGRAVFSFMATGLKQAGKLAGASGGLIVAGLDLLKAKENIEEKQFGLAVLYTVSAVAGLGATAAITFVAMLGSAAIPVIGMFVMLVVLVGLIIEYSKDNPIQDWLERCPWGVLEDKRYPDMATEQSQLMQALT